MGEAALDTVQQLPDFRVRRIATLLSNWRYLFGTEVHLQEAVAKVLADTGEKVAREYVLDPKNRADVMLADGIVVEVKIDGSLSAALRQCERYSRLQAVTGIVLASAVSWARRPLVSRPRMNGKPFALVFLPRQAL